MTKRKADVSPIEEVWLITQPIVNALHQSESGPALYVPMKHPIVLQGFHPRTKALLHTYGPFATPEELIQFAAEHSIRLPE